MNSATEKTSRQTAPHSTVAGHPIDQTEAGDETTGADTEIWAETDHGIETGNETGMESDTRETGAERGMMTAAGIGDEVRRENAAGRQTEARAENEGRGEEATVATKEAIRKQKTNSCLKGT